MNENVKEYLDKYTIELKELYTQLRDIIYHSVPQEIEEKLWAKLDKSGISFGVSWG